MYKIKRFQKLGLSEDSENSKQIRIKYFKNNPEINKTHPMKKYIKSKKICIRKHSIYPVNPKKTNT